MDASIVLLLLMVSTRIQAGTQADTHKDEPNTERFLQEEVRQILQEEVRQILQEEVRQIFQMNLTGSTSLEAFEMIEKITATQTNLTSDMRELTSAQTMIDNKITAITDDLRHELASAQTMIENKITAIQANMSSDLRQELASSQAMIDNKTTVIRDDLRQELGSVQSAVKADQAVMETNIVRRLNDTIKEHNKHNNVGQKYYFDLSQDDRDKMVERIQITNAYLREIHPLLKSQLNGNVTAYRRETTNQLDQMATTLDQLKGELACLPSPCQNGGTCTLSDDGSSYSCSCGPEYTGDNCENSACLSSPCQNGGTCTPGADGTYSCSCGPEYTGDNCENSEWITHIPREGRLYYVSNTTCNYSTCRAECERLGADLVTIESAEETAFVASIAPYAFWLSIYKSTPNVRPGTWVVNPDSNRQIAYTNWRSGYPTAASWRCAVSHRSVGYAWLDQPCTTIYYCICEK